MTSDEYKYDEQASVAKNIATALFAIANELNRQSENQSQQSLGLNNMLKKELSGISDKITFLYDTIKTVSATNEEDENATKTRNAQVIEQLNNIAENLKWVERLKCLEYLDRIDEILRKHFSKQDDEDYTANYHSGYFSR